MLRKAKPNRETAARVQAALERPPVQPDRLAIARIDAELRRLALSLVERSDTQVLEEMADLRSEQVRIADLAVDASLPTTEEALSYLADLGKLWAETDDEGRRALATGILTRLGAIEGRIVDVEVTAAAERHGLVLALPTQVTVVGDTGFEPVTSRM